MSRTGAGPAQLAGARGRVAADHAQSRPTLILVVGFAVAVGVAAVVPHRTGVWLPLHLFLAGWRPARHLGGHAAVDGDEGGGAGATGPGRRRPAGAPGRRCRRPSPNPRGGRTDPISGGRGLAVIASLILLGLFLWRIRQASVQARFAPVVDHYLAALAFGVAGSAAGVLLATDTGPCQATGSSLRI